MFENRIAQDADEPSNCTAHRPWLSQGLKRSLAKRTDIESLWLGFQMTHPTWLRGSQSVKWCAHCLIQGQRRMYFLTTETKTGTLHHDIHRWWHHTGRLAVSVTSFTSVTCYLIQTKSPLSFSRRHGLELKVLSAMLSVHPPRRWWPATRTCDQKGLSLS